MVPPPALLELYLRGTLSVYTSTQDMSRILGGEREEKERINPGYIRGSKGFYPPYIVRTSVFKSS